MIAIRVFILAAATLTDSSVSSFAIACPVSRFEVTWVSFGRDYLECACGTLVRSVMPVKDITRVRDEESDLYGRNYWFAHQAELGLPDLEDRRVTDLLGRCFPWLRTVLGYKRPPGRALEIGAAHGRDRDRTESVGR
jgi:hypothetical protein